MQAYVLETALGQALVPEGAHVYVGLNPRVATLARIEDINEAGVFFEKQELDYVDFLNLCPQLDENGVLYPETGYGRTPLPRAAISKSMLEENYWDSSATERALRGAKLSKGNIKSAVKFLNDCGMKFTDREVAALLSRNPGMPSDWPWRELGRAWNDFGSENQSQARLYSRRRQAIDAAIANGAESVEIDGACIELPVRFPRYFLVKGKRGEKRESEPDLRVLTLEGSGPEAVNSIYSDYWQLVQDYEIIKASAEMLLYNYLVQTYREGKKKARKAAEIVAESLTGSPVFDSESNLEDALILIQDLNRGKVGEYYSDTNFLNRLIHQASQLKGIIPEDFMDIYRKKISAQTDSLASRLSAFFKSDRAKRREIERKASEGLSRLSRAEAPILKNYAMAEKQPKDFLGTAVEDVMKRNPEFKYQDVIRIMSKTPEKYIQPEDFASTASRYSLPLIESVAEPIFS